AFAQFLHKLAAISALTAFLEDGGFARFAQNHAVPVSETTGLHIPTATLIVGWKIAKLVKRRTGTISASTLRIAFLPLISKLAYAAPEIHNLCRQAENHLGTCLSMLDDSGDFRTAR